MTETDTKSEGPAVEKAIEFTNTDGAVWDVDVALWVDDVCQEARHATEADLLAAGYVPASALEAARAELATERERFRQLHSLAHPAACTWSRDGDGNKSLVGARMNALYLFTSDHKPPASVSSSSVEAVEGSEGAERVSHQQAWGIAVHLKWSQGFETINRYIAQQEAASREMMALADELNTAREDRDAMRAERDSAETNFAKARNSIAALRAENELLKRAFDAALEYLDDQACGNDGKDPAERQRLHRRAYDKIRAMPVRDFCGSCNRLSCVCDNQPTEATPVAKGPRPTAYREPRQIAYRGSVTDLATDVAFELTPEQTAELIQELERFRSSEPAKFRATPVAKIEAPSEPALSCSRNCEGGASKDPRDHAVNCPKSEPAPQSPTTGGAAEKLVQREGSAAAVRRKMHTCALTQATADGSVPPPCIPCREALAAERPAQAEQKEPACWCQRCEDDAGTISPFARRMILCPKCGNKRCPKAEWHDYQCSGSNETGQVGVEEDKRPGEASPAGERGDFGKHDYRVTRRSDPHYGRVGEWRKRDGMLVWLLIGGDEHVFNISDIDPAQPQPQGDGVERLRADIVAADALFAGLPNWLDDMRAAVGALNPDPPCHVEVAKLIDFSKAALSFMNTLHEHLREMRR
jgi:hypothetical protein